MPARSFPTNELLPMTNPRPQCLSQASAHSGRNRAGRYGGPAIDSLRWQQEELAENARARIPFYLEGVKDNELRQLEARAAELRAGIRAEFPPPVWDQPDHPLSRLVRAG
jgi:hypothetical protein